MANFMDFIEKVSEPTSPIRKEFLEQVYKKNQNPKDLLEWFYAKKYYGVSQEDCDRLLRFAVKIPLEDLLQKY